MAVDSEIDPNGPQSPEETSGDVYVPGPDAVDVTEAKDGGILKEIIREGKGDDGPKDGEKVVVHYVGRLENGCIFDSSRKRGEYFEFSLGKGAVIKGWEVGVATMKKGEVAMLTCKPEYAYGKGGMPPDIPGDSTLYFEVELIDWKLEDLTSAKDGGVLRRILVKGDEYASPNEGALVNVHITGKLDGTVFEDRDVSFCLGEGNESGVVEGIEIALQKANKKETSLLKISSKYAFGKAGNPNLKIPADAPELEYVVTLDDFEKAKEVWKMDGPEKLEQAGIAKEKGTALFKAGKYEASIKQYKRIGSLLDFDSKSLEGEARDKRVAIVQAGSLNLAMCYLKTEKYIEAIKACDKALETDPDNAKGLFRRGQARLAINDFEEAKRDFEAVLKVEPNNKAASNQVIVCTNKIREYRNRERKTYRSMFLSLPTKDSKNSNDTETGVWENNKENVAKDSENMEASDCQTLSA